MAKDFFHTAVRHALELDAWHIKKVFMLLF